MSPATTDLIRATTHQDVILRHQSTEAQAGGHLVEKRCISSTFQRIPEPKLKQQGCTHRLPGLNVGRSVRQDGFEDRLQGLEHLLALDARAQLDAQEAGQRRRRPLLLTFAWKTEEQE